MSLPVVSMEDAELFPKNKAALDISEPLKPLSIDEFEKVSNRFSRLLP
jgi:hypothetical protein